MSKRAISKKSVLLLAASAVLLVGSAVGSTRAALTYYSDNYVAEVSVSNIGVSLNENGKQVIGTSVGQSDDSETAYKGMLLENLLADGETFALGKTYQEELSVTNTGSIDTYVRVIVHKSWIDANGEKDQKLSPELIHLNLTGNGWVEDTDASTKERTVLYYTTPLAAGDSTSVFADSISVDPSISTKVTESVTEQDGYKTITYDYAYDGYTFQVEVEVNAVQTHNAQDAIKSAWGVDVDVLADQSLSLR